MAYAFLTDLFRQVANVLLPAHGGTGSTHGEGRVVIQAFNRSGGDLPLYTAVEWANVVSKRVVAVTATDSTEVLGVVVGYFDLTGLLVEADAPDNSTVAVQTSGIAKVLIEGVVTAGEYAFIAATNGTMYSDATLAAGAFGVVLQNGDTGEGITEVEVQLPLLNASAGSGGGSFGTPALTLGTSNAAGVSGDAIATDSTVALFDATVPAGLGTAATGAAGKAARRDHVHPAPGGLVVVVSAPVAGVVCDIEMPFAGTWTSWRVLNDAAGSIQYDLWNDTYGNFPPTVADTITAADKPNTTTAAKAESSGVPSWSGGLAFSAGNIIRVNIDSTSGLGRSVLSLRYART